MIIRRRKKILFRKINSLEYKKKEKKSITIKIIWNHNLVVKEHEYIEKI